jgi:omega-6 fatty acid desaturase (delta-12 desaturase)
VWTLTYDEFHKLPRGQRWFYRLYRNPFVIFIIGPTIDFLILQRIGKIVNVSDKPREKWSVIYTNIALLVMAIVMSALIGWQNFVLIQLPIIAMASSAGVWMFYVQHQFENVYWERHENWNYADAALHGSSFYKLPRWLQWCTGNIGFHHIHHLSPRIPNYKLEECHYENEMFMEIEPLTLRTSLKSLHIRLFDEDRHKMIGYHREDGPETTPVPATGVAAAPASATGAD